MKEVSFNERVKKIAIDEAKNYKKVYIDYEYLILANDFEKKYYIISGQEKNYLHLLGVHTTLDQKTFYDKCISEELIESDFDFIDADGKDIKGTVRRKIKVLSNMNELMGQKKLYVQEKFSKNKVICTLGATDYLCTVGFMKSSSRITAKAFPKTLMKNNELKNAKEVDLLLRRKKDSKKFDEIIIGNRELVKKHFEDLKDIVSIDLYVTMESNNIYCFKEIKVYEKIKVPVCFQANTYSEKLKVSDE